MNPLNALGQEIIEINRANGWNVTVPTDWPTHEDQEGEVYKLGTVLCLIHSEVSEALEALRHRDRMNFEEELADTLIRVLDCAAGLGIDMDKAVADKLDRNRQRGFRHGGKAV